MSCKGLLGMLLGHRLKAVYDMDEERLTPEEVQSTLAAIGKYNFWNINNSVQPDLYHTKRITKVYRGHVCTRCGHRVEDEKMKI